MLKMVQTAELTAEAVLGSSAEDKTNGIHLIILKKRYRLQW